MKKRGKSPKSMASAEPKAAKSDGVAAPPLHPLMVKATLGMAGFGIIAVVVVVLDQWSKLKIVSIFGTPENGDSIIIVPRLFRLVYRVNTGAAFSMLRDHTFALAIFSSLIALAIFLWAFYLAPREHAMRWPLGLILGGAIGNLIDRFRLGSVIDFLDAHWDNKYHFPTFNIADSAIFVGMVILIIFSFISGEPKRDEVKET